MWWTFATFGIGVMSVLEFALDRRHRGNVRAATRRSKEAMEALSRSERREVGQAVRHGRAVTDLRLAPAAVAMAEASGAGRHGSWRWVTGVVFLVWVTAPAVAAWVDRRWALAASLTLGPVLIGAFFAVGVAFSGRAADALDANQRMLDRQAPPAAGG